MCPLYCDIQERRGGPYAHMLTLRGACSNRRACLHSWLLRSGWMLAIWGWSLGQAELVVRALPGFSAIQTLIRTQQPFLLLRRGFMPTILACRRLRQEDLKFDPVSQDNIRTWRDGRRLGMRTALADDPDPSASTHVRELIMAFNSSPGDPASSGLHRHLHTCGTYKLTHTHTTKERF